MVAAVGVVVVEGVVEVGDKKGAKWSGLLCCYSGQLEDLRPRFITSNTSILLFSRCFHFDRAHNLIFIILKTAKIYFKHKSDP